MAKKTKTSGHGWYMRGEVYYSRIAGPDGKMIRKRLGADKQTALAVLAEMRKTVVLQKGGVLPENMEEEIKLSRRLKEMYLERLRTLGRSPKTLEAFMISWKYVVEENKLDRIDQITVTNVQKFADRRKAKGTKGQTINHYVGLVKDALDWAREFEYIRRNPLARWEDLKKDSPRFRRDMTPEEITKFFERERDLEFRLRWMIYFTTGLRATAGTRVEWSWVLWNECVLLLPAWANKSGVDHRIPLDPGTLAELRSRYEEGCKAGNPGAVFPEIGTAQLRTRFRKICMEAGIDLNGLCLHSIRHTYATRAWIASGYNLKAVQSLLCHADPATTMQYLHVGEHELRDVNDKVGAEIRAQIAAITATA